MVKVRLKGEYLLQSPGVYGGVHGLEALPARFRGHFHEKSA